MIIKKDFTPKKHKIKLAIIVLLIVVIICSIFYAFRGKFIKKMKVIYTAESGQLCKFSKTDDELVVLTRESIKMINKKGNTTFSMANSASAPSISVAGKYALIYDRNGNEFTIIHNNKKIKSIKTDMPIITAKINRSGYTAIASYETGYKSKVVVYNQNGYEVYKWRLGDNYIIDMDISLNCTKLVATMAKTDQPAEDNEKQNVSTAVKCRTVVIDINEAKIKNEITYDNTLPIKVQFTKGNEILLATDTKLCMIDTSGKERWNVDFNDKIIKSVNLSDNGDSVLIFDGIKNNSSLEIYDSVGKKSGEYTTKSNVNCIDIYNNTIAIAEQRTITILSYKGRVKTIKETANDVKYVTLLDSKNAAVTISNDVQLMKF